MPHTTFFFRSEDGTYGFYALWYPIQFFGKQTPLGTAETTTFNHTFDLLDNLLNVPKGPIG